ncbi:MAG: hypothetical protein AAB225_09665 [Acidobacteriota bacterium]
MKKFFTARLAAGLPILLALIAQSALAQQGPQGPFANVSAAAVCTVTTTTTGTDVLVNALLVQKQKPGPGTYEVPRVTYSLEQKIPGNPKFQEVGGSRVIENLGLSIPEVAAGQSVEVDSHLYENVCTNLRIDPRANAVRAVVEITVSNANPHRGLDHTGRCLSFPNPCKR